MLLFMMPKGLYARALGVYFLLLLAVHVPKKPAPQEAWITWLDVGQGLSTVVQTAHHVLVYDTGPAYEDFEVAAFTLVPFLKYAGIQQIDMLLISHTDNDHRGGIHRILGMFDVKKLIVGQYLSDIDYPQTSCHENKTWHWDGVLFEQWAVRGNWKSPNNHSCVLKITTGNQSVLLLGDLERDAEAALLHKHQSLRATMISVPHHGSKTSSSPMFLEAVQPEYAIFSTGFLNSYHHPHPTVLQRYQDMGVKIRDTAQLGAIRATLTGNGPIGITCHRSATC